MFQLYAFALLLILSIHLYFLESKIARIKLLAILGILKLTNENAGNMLENVVFADFYRTFPSILFFIHTKTFFITIKLIFEAGTF